MPKKTAPPPSGKKKWLIAALLLLLMFSGLLAYAFSGDPALAAVRALGEQMRDDNLTDEQRRELRGQMHDAWENLSDESKQLLREERRARFEAHETERMREFFSMTKQEQVASLDKQIDGWERRRKEREANGGQGGRTGGPGAGGPGGGGGGGRGGDGFRGGGRNANLDPNVAAQRRRDMLDKTSPEGRAGRGEYRAMSKERRNQRGI